MTKYMVVWHDLRKIHKVEVIRETPAQVVLMKDWFGKPQERREAKDSSYGKYFDTYKEAYDAIKSRLQNRLSNAESTVSSARAALIKFLDETVAEENV